MFVIQVIFRRKHYKHDLKFLMTGLNKNKQIHLDYSIPTAAP